MLSVERTELCYVPWTIKLRVVIIRVTSLTLMILVGSILEFTIVDKVVGPIEQRLAYDERSFPWRG